MKLTIGTKQKAGRYEYIIKRDRENILEFRENGL